MARKDQRHLIESPPPAASSSDEEEEDSSDDEQPTQPPPQQHSQSSSSSSEEDDDESSEQNSPSSPPQPKTLNQKKKLEESQKQKPTESDCESDSDSDLPPPPPKKSSKSKSAATPPVTVLASPAPASKPKRQRATEKDKGTPKKAKKEKVEVSDNPQEDGKKPLFQRIWSDDDEVAVLQSLIEYKAKKGIDPLADGDGFSEFVKKSVHVDVNRAQIMSKIRSLRRKFETARRRKQITDPHGMKILELGKQIWEADDVKSNGNVEGKNLKSKSAKKLKGVNNESVSKAEKEDDGEDKVHKLEDLRGLEINLEALVKPDVLRHEILVEGIKLLDDSEKQILEDKRRKQNIAEMEVYLKRLYLIKETTQMVLNAMKSEDK